jgi:AcrR family transcriptional regulator
MPSSSGRTGRPPVTSRAQILAAARLMIERDGWRALTIRRLATEVGVSATTLYHHVRDREDVLIQLLNDYADQIPHPELPDDQGERIVAAATAIHNALKELPWVVEILSADDLIGDSSLWLVETIVAAAIQAGCDDEQAVHLYRSIWYYTAGELMVQANSRHRRSTDDRPVYRDGVMSSSAAESNWPQLARLADRWPSLTAQDTYELGLRALISGMLPGRADLGDLDRHQD